MPKVWEFVLDLPREDSGKIFKRKLENPIGKGTIAGYRGAGQQAGMGSPRYLPRYI